MDSKNVESGSTTGEPEASVNVQVLPVEATLTTAMPELPPNSAR
jgi:hypothetical protein